MANDDTEAYGAEQVVAPQLAPVEGSDPVVSATQSPAPTVGAPSIATPEQQWAEPGLPASTNSGGVHAPRRHRSGGDSAAGGDTQILGRVDDSAALAPAREYTPPAPQANPMPTAQQHYQPPVPQQGYQQGPGQQGYQQGAGQQYYGQQAQQAPRYGQQPQQARPAAAAQQPQGQQQFAPQYGSGPANREAPMSTATDAAETRLSLQEQAAVPLTGFRAFLRSIGIKNIGPSTKALERAELISHIRAPKDAFHVTGVIGNNAGTTLLVGTLGQVINRNRSDDTVVLDLDPDGGNLDSATAWHSGKKTARTLLNEPDLSDKNRVNKHLSTTQSSTAVPTDLRVLSSVFRHDKEDVVTRDDVLDLFEIFEHHYSIALIDGGSGLQTSTGLGILDISSALILPAAATTRGVRRVSGVVDWLRSHGYHGLLANTLVVFNHIKKNSTVEREAFEELFRTGQKLQVHEIPYDPHLDADKPVDIDQLKPETLRAFEELAALLASTYLSKYVPPVVAEASQSNDQAEVR